MPAKELRFSAGEQAGGMIERTATFTTTPQALPIFLSDRQAANLLGCSRSHWRNLHRLGLCPAPIHLGHSTRWRRDELIAWVNAGAPVRHQWRWNVGLTRNMQKK